MASTLLNGNGGTTANATANSTNETNDMKIGSSNEQHGGAAHTSLQMGQLDSNGGTTVILSRLKELENINQNLAKNLEEVNHFLSHTFHNDNNNKNNRNDEHICIFRLNLN